MSATYITLIGYISWTMLLLLVLAGYRTVLSKKMKTLKFAYSRRIQRPSLRFLNPNVNASNPLDISQGNPNLEPEFTNNFESPLEVANGFLKYNKDNFYIYSKCYSLFLFYYLDFSSQPFMNMNLFPPSPNIPLNYSHLNKKSSLSHSLSISSFKNTNFDSVASDI